MPLGLLRDVSGDERTALYRSKLALCSVMYDFRDESCQAEKDTKRQTLLEVIEFINIKRSITEDLYSDTAEMVRKNLFRPLAPCPRDFQPNHDPDEEEPFLEPSWPHLQLVYEFLLRFIVSSDVDPKVAKRHIGKAFLIQLLELFDSEDPRERDYLKTILHRAYGKFMSHRPFIRRSISNVFWRFIYEKPHHSGISELLEILGSIINGFALPLKEEHKTFLVKVLLPLHKPTKIDAFHQQLSYCVAQVRAHTPPQGICRCCGLRAATPTSHRSRGGGGGGGGSGGGGGGGCCCCC
jgi:serine/threonine-protein phosphatase 2A regulatory subunit B'